VIGKGILRFHSVYWPAFLLSAGEPLPTRVQVHPYLTVDGQKISKSAGRNAHPADIAETYGADALRWFFAREVAETVDTDFTETRLVERANADLANLLGNTTSRLVALVHKFLAGVAPPGGGLAVPDLPDQIAVHIGGFRLRDATRLIVEAATQLNRDIETSAPWKLGDQPDALRGVLAEQLAAARQLARAAEPIVPRLAGELRARLGVPGRRLPTAALPPFERLSAV
jgi:methionyl-tRNA synthetase